MLPRKIALGVLAITCIGARLWADGLPTEPDAAYQALVAAYDAEVSSRPAWDMERAEAHTAEIRAVLAGADGNAIITTSAGVLVWSASLGSVELWADDEQQSLSHFVDGASRVAFEGTNFSGFVDTLDGEHLFLLLQIDGAASLWVCDIDGTTNNISIALPIEVNPTKCLCKGSNNVCPNGRIACPVGAGCTYTDVTGAPHASTCKWLIAPL